MKKIKVIELFAGVGGFRVGLEGFPKKKNSNYEVVWSNQWEPASPEHLQHANWVYRYHFGNHKKAYKNTIHSEVDIKTVDARALPEHDMLVGGFPCQDFSVGALNKLSKGLEGEKGTLWYQIRRILESNKRRGVPTKYFILENVDRLLKCPVALKGADFYTILKNLNRIGYAVEWKVINAGDYNMPQRRRRTFLIGYYKETEIYKHIMKSGKNWLLNEGVLAKSFKSIFQENFKDEFIKMSSLKNYFYERINRETSGLNEFEINTMLASDKKIQSPFENSGLLLNRKVFTKKHQPKKDKNCYTLRDIIIPEKDVPAEYFSKFTVSKKDFEEKWKPAKGAKKQTRIVAGFTYNWSEGGMSETDSLDKPSRTIITSEGGASASRTKHIIEYEKGKYRRLLPEELDQLNMLKKDFTKFGKKENGKVVEIDSSRRAFLMGNALVVGVIERIGNELKKRV